jgi:hypothetical protein
MGLAQSFVLGSIGLFLNYTKIIGERYGKNSMDEKNVISF